MDPNATLTKIRQLINDSEDILLANAIQDLDKWLSMGGFLPEPWAKHRRATL